MGGDLILGDEPVETENGGVEIPNRPVAPPSEMQGVDTETWQDVYVDFATQQPNIAVADAYTGDGGFLGDVDSPGAYSYITPKLSENFYKTRVKLGMYFGQMRAFIDAKVLPVFAAGVTDKVRSSGSDEYLDDDAWLDISYDATGTDKSLNELREEASIEAYLHDVSYWIADKIDERVVYRIKSAKDVDRYEVDPRTKELVSITFWESSFIDDNGATIYVKHEWRVNNGKGELVIYHGKTDGRRRDGYKFEVVDTIPTGLSRLNVYPMFAEKAPVGDYKPHRPKSYEIARLCCGLYNLICVLNYVMFKQGHGLYVFQGQVNGLRDALSNIVEIPANEPGGRSFGMPTILTPDPDMPRVHLEIIKEYINFMIGIMSNNGVTAVENKSAESGLSKAFDLVGTVDTYKRTIEVNKRADRWLKEIFDEFMGRPAGKYEYETVYPREFFPTDAIDALDMIEVARAYEERGLDAAAAEMFREVARRTLKDSPDDRMKDILDEIESYLSAAGNNDGGTSPTEKPEGSE